MKNFLVATLLFGSVSAFAMDSKYSCKSSQALDVGLPTSMSVELKGSSIGITDKDTGKSHSGMRTSRSSRLAMGFEDLIQNGYVMISSEMLKAKKQAKLMIFDEALDSVETNYSCIKE